MKGYFAGLQQLYRQKKAEKEIIITMFLSLVFKHLF